MVQHICNRCGYITNRKQNLRSHLLRKNICQPLMNEIERYDLLVSHGFDKESIMYGKTTILPQKPHQNTPKSHQNTPKKIYKCKFCEKNFSRSDALKRHIDSRCKEKKNISSQIEILMENIVIMQKEMELIKKENKEKDKIIDKLLKNNKPNVNRGNINNAENQLNNNVIINNFGSENIDYITDKIFYRLLNTPINAIPKLLELKHFHPKQPENHNVKITNLHDKYAKIYKDKQWLTKNKKEVIDDIIDYCMADFDDFKEQKDGELTSTNKSSFKKLEEEYDEKSKSLFDKSLLASFNGSEKIYVFKDANNIVV